MKKRPSMKMNNDAIDRAVAATLEVAAGIGPAEPRPFFVERTMAAASRRQVGARYAVRTALPRLSLAMLLVLLVLNAYTAVRRGVLADGAAPRAASVEDVARGYGLGSDEDALVFPAQPGGVGHE